MGHWKKLMDKEMLYAFDLDGRDVTVLTGTPDTEKWSNIRVTLFPTTTNFGGKTVDCIRIRPYLPKDTGGKRGKEDGAALTQQIADEMASQATGTVPRDTDVDGDLDVPGASE